MHGVVWIDRSGPLCGPRTNSRFHSRLCHASASWLFEQQTNSSNVRLVLPLQATLSPAGSEASEASLSSPLEAFSDYMNSLGFLSAHVFTLLDHEVLARAANLYLCVFRGEL